MEFVPGKSQLRPDAGERCTVGVHAREGQGRHTSLGSTDDPKTGLSGGAALVTMVQSADLWDGHDIPQLGWLHRPGSARAGPPGFERGLGYSGWIRSLTIQCLLYVYGRTSGFQRPKSEVSFQSFDIGSSAFSTS